MSHSRRGPGQSLRLCCRCPLVSSCRPASSASGTAVPMPGTTLARGRGLVDEQRAGKGGEETGSSHTASLQARECWLRPTWRIARRWDWTREAARAYRSRAGAAGRRQRTRDRGMLSRTSGGESASPHDRILTKRHPAVRWADAGFEVHAANQGGRGARSVELRARPVRSQEGSGPGRPASVRPWSLSLQLCDQGRRHRLCWCLAS